MPLRALSVYCYNTRGASPYNLLAHEQVFAPARACCPTSAPEVVRRPGPRLSVSPGGFPLDRGPPVTACAVRGRQMDATPRASGVCPTAGTTPSRDQFNAALTPTTQGGLAPRPTLAMQPRRGELTWTCGSQVNMSEWFSVSATCFTRALRQRRRRPSPLASMRRIGSISGSTSSSSRGSSSSGGSRREQRPPTRSGGSSSSGGR